MVYNIVFFWVIYVIQPKCITHYPLDKMATISWTIFSDAFSWRKKMNFDYNFTEGCCQVSNWLQTSIVSDNGLAPYRRQVECWHFKKVTWGCPVNTFVHEQCWIWLSQCLSYLLKHRQTHQHCVSMRYIKKVYSTLNVQQTANYNRWWRLSWIKKNPPWPFLGTLYTMLSGHPSNVPEKFSFYIWYDFQLMFLDSNPANTQRNKRVIITSKRRFGVIITCLLRFV